MKSGQQSPANINLGNQTYDRGVSDGMAQRPKSIKKSHQHAHRYHCGYRHGQQERAVYDRSRSSSVPGLNGTVTIIHGEGAQAIKKAGLLSRIMAWIRP